MGSVTLISGNDLPRIAETARKIVDKRRHDHRQRRGDGVTVRSLDVGSAEDQVIQVIGDEPTPEMLRGFELFVDIGGLGNIDAAGGAFGRIVKFAERSMAGSGIVPGIGTFPSNARQGLDDLNRERWVQLLE